MSTAISAQDITGLWQVLDDKTHQPRCIFSIYHSQDEKYEGRLVSICEAHPPYTKCTKCDRDDPRYGQPIIGMVLIKDLHQEGERWCGGQILDPETGNEYRCCIWREGNKLMLRGYWGFLYRTQTWYRVSGQTIPCESAQ